MGTGGHPRSVPFTGNQRLLPLGPAHSGFHSEQGPWVTCTLGTPRPLSRAHSGVIVGASVSHYLLEASRVVFQVRPVLLLASLQLPRVGEGEGPCRECGC